MKRSFRQIMKRAQRRSRLQGSIPSSNMETIPPTRVTRIISEIVFRIWSPNWLIAP